MKGNIEIKTETDPSLTAPQVIIRTNGDTGLAERIARAVSECMNDDTTLVAYNNSTAVVLDKHQIFRVFTENRKLIIATDTDRYDSKLTLKEMDEVLDETEFVRISRFEIVNIKKISAFDMSMSGTIRVIFENGTESWVARRYVRSIREVLSKKLEGVTKHE